MFYLTVAIMPEKGFTHPNTPMDMADEFQYSIKFGL